MKNKNRRSSYIKDKDVSKDYDGRVTNTFSEIEGQHLYWSRYFQENFDQTDDIFRQESDSFYGLDERIVEFSILRNWEESKNKSGAGVRFPRTEGRFWYDLCSCNTAYILDLHFFENELKYILDVLKRKNSANKINLENIIILCSKDGCNRIKKDAILDGYCQVLQIVMEVYNVERLDKCGFSVHDRFALLDDEIWHFGCTVGGITSTLTAYSGGWKDTGGKFREYLDKMVENATK